MLDHAGKVIEIEDIEARVTALEQEALKTTERGGRSVGICRLESRFGLQPETKSTRRLRERLEAARRRLAELNGEAPPDAIQWRRDDLS